MDWWGWLLVSMGGLTAIAAGVKAVRELIRPASKLVERVKEIERREQADLKRFEEMNDRFAQQEKMDQALFKGVIALMDHAANGNGIENLQRARKEMTNFIIEN